MRIILLLGIIFPLFIIAQNEKKIALIIGNKNYIDPSAELTNPLNDSDLMKNTFEKLNFDSVIIANDLNYDQMKSAFSSYRTALRGDFNIGFIYYSGHGTQDQYQNSFLIPIDFPKNPTITDVEDKAYDFTNFIIQLERIENKLHVIILDACRNNPFEKGWKGKSATGTGLSVPKETVDGILIHYSTTAGKTASDNTSLKNSLYTQILSEELLVPNQEIESIFKSTKKRVMEESKKLGIIQSPKSYGNWVGSLTLLRKKDYNKIEVKDLKKEAEEAIKNGETEVALKKYSALQHYFETSIENIDKKALIDVYINLGQIYWDTRLDEATEFYEKNKDREWASIEQKYNLLKNIGFVAPMNAFKNAKILLEIEGIKTNSEKKQYSEVFYKYLRCLSYLDYANGGIDNKKLIEKIDLLNKFNEENFGLNDIRTANSYYLTGIFYSEEDNYHCYKFLTKANKIFEKNKFKDEDLMQYSLSDKNDIYSLYWSNKTIIDKMESIWEKTTINEKEIHRMSLRAGMYTNIHNNPDSIYEILKSSYLKLVDLSEKKDTSYMQWTLDQGGDLFFLFPVIFTNSITIDPQMDFEKNTLLRCKKGLIDSIITYRDIGVNYANHLIALRKGEKKDIKIIEKIKTIEQKKFTYFEKAYNLATKKSSYKNAIFLTNQFLDDYYYNFYYNYNTDTLLLNKEKLISKIDFINKNWNEISKTDHFSYILKYFALMRKEFKNMIKDGLALPSDLVYKSQIQYFDFAQRHESPYHIIKSGIEVAINHTDPKERRKYCEENINYILKKNKYWSELKETGRKLNNSQSTTPPTKLDVVKDLWLSSWYYIENKDEKWNKTDSLITLKLRNFLNFTYYSPKQKNQELLKQYKILLNLNVMRLELDKAYNKYDSEEITKIFMLYAEEAERLFSLPKKEYNLFAQEENFSEMIKTHFWEIYKNEKNEKIVDKEFEKYLKILEKFTEYDAWFSILYGYQKWVEFHYDQKNYKKMMKLTEDIFAISERTIEEKRPKEKATSNDWKVYNFRKYDTYWKLCKIGKTNTNYKKTPLKNRNLMVTFAEKFIDHCKIPYFENEENQPSTYFERVKEAYYYMGDEYFSIDKSKCNEAYSEMIIWAKKIKNQEVKEKEVLRGLSFKAYIHNELGQIDSAITTYNDYIKFHPDLDHRLNKNYSYTIKNIEYGNCSVPFLNIELITKASGVYPFIEFDINNNGIIDENTDLRYWVNEKSKLNSEYIIPFQNKNEIEKENWYENATGGYIYSFTQPNGEMSDTTKKLFFDKSSKLFNTSALLQQYYYSVKNGDEFGNIDSSSKNEITKEAASLKKWTFSIPLSEIKYENSNTISFIIGSCRKNPNYYTYDRVWKKDVLPSSALYKGFIDAIKIDLEK